MKRTLIFLICLNWILCRSQNNAIISGKVLTNNGLGISYASIVETNNQYGTAADVNGDFKLILVNSNNLSDSLHITAIGYEDRVIQFKELLNNNIITLKEKPVVLQEIAICRSKKVKTYVLGAKTHSLIDRGFCGIKPGFQWALYIENETNKSMKIKQVDVFITSFGKYYTPIRLRLYNFDTNSKLPDLDLLTTSLIKYSTKSNTWLSFNIEKENIYLPKNGLVAAIEWINCGDEFYYSSGDENNYQYYGVTIGMTRDIKSNNCFVKAIGGKWHKNINDSGTNLNPAIRVICND